MDYNSVDLTEDEDSRETIFNVQETKGLSYFSYPQVTGNIPKYNTLSPCTPPPLTPICEIKSIRDRRLLTNQHRTTVPKLKRIQRSNIHSEQTKVPIQVPLNQSDSVDENTNFDHQTDQQMSGTFQSCVSPSKSITGKEWTIKKNGKMYKIVIPHNVLPSLNQSNGSVVVNVPEIGPIMLKINPQYKNLTVPELEPFSLNFDAIMESAEKPPSQDNCPKNMSHLIYETGLMFDPRFCWIQPKYKHYAHSFKVSFFGFSKTDMQKARRCFRNFTLNIKKLEKIIESKKVDFGKKYTKNVGKGNTFIKVNNDTNSSAHNVFVQVSDKIASDVTYQHIYVPIPFQRCNDGNVPNFTIQSNPNKNMYIPLSSYINKSESNFEEGTLSKDQFSLDNVKFSVHNSCSVGQKCTPKKSSNLLSLRRKPSIRMIKKKGTNIYLKPCFVKLFRDKNIENIVKLYKTNGSLLTNNAKFKPIEEMSSNEKLTLFISKLINSDLKFQTEIAYIKPMLIVNKFNFSIIHYKSEFSRSNIVFCVDQKRKFPREILENNDFVHGVNLGYVKLVDCKLLVRYLKGDVEPVDLSN